MAKAAVEKRDLAALEAAVEGAETREGIEFVKEGDLAYPAGAAPGHPGAGVVAMEDLGAADLGTGPLRNPVVQLPQLGATRDLLGGKAPLPSKAKPRVRIPGLSGLGAEGAQYYACLLNINPIQPACEMINGSGPRSLCKANDYVPCVIDKA